MAPAIRAAALPLILATLAACGGGGGGGGGVIVPGPSEPPPASFASAGANQTIVMQGNSVALDVTPSISGATVTFTPVGAASINDATVNFSFDSASELSGISITTPQASLSFDRKAADHTLECRSSGLCVAENPSALALTVDPFAERWNYQSFGIWAMESGPDIKLGAVSAGGLTQGNSLPTTGTATFNGLAAGFYIDAGGTLWGTAATMRADVNFGSRSILFSTSSTVRGNDPQDPKVGNRDDGLNLSGTLSYAQGVNNFSGSLKTQNDQLSGQGTGRFYGPAAEEIGGVYSLSGSGVSRMVGGFGGKR
jgi:hypothetical protein